MINDRLARSLGEPWSDNGPGVGRADGSAGTVAQLNQGETFGTSGVSPMVLASAPEKPIRVLLRSTSGGWNTIKTEQALSTRPAVPSTNCFSIHS